jgi:hypothetical protein
MALVASCLGVALAESLSATAFAATALGGAFILVIAAFFGTLFCNTRDWACVDPAVTIEAAFCKVPLFARFPSA